MPRSRGSVGGGEKKKKGVGSAWGQKPIVREHTLAKRKRERARLRVLSPKVGKGSGGGFACFIPGKKERAGLVNGKPLRGGRNAWRKGKKRASPLIRKGGSGVGSRFCLAGREERKGDRGRHGSSLGETSRGYRNGQGGRTGSGKRGGLLLSVVLFEGGRKKKSGPRRRRRGG